MNKLSPMANNKETKQRKVKNFSTQKDSTELLNAKGNLSKFGRKLKRKQLQADRLHAWSAE